MRSTTPLYNGAVVLGARVSGEVGKASPSHFRNSRQRRRARTLPRPAGIAPFPGGERAPTSFLTVVYIFHTSFMILGRLRHLSAHLAPPVQIRPFSSTSSIMTSSLPSQMRACSIAKQGGLENIAVESVEVPSVGPTDVLIKVGYAGVNMIDTYHRGGVYKLETPFTLGTEASGTVAALGSNVKDLSVGDRVASYGLGAFAEYCKAARSKVVKLPEGLGEKEGAAALLQGLTAWTLLKEAYPVKKGDWVLVHAAAGGVGLLLCQVSKIKV